MKFLDLFAGIQTSWQLSRSQCGCGDSKGIEMKLKINRRDSFQKDYEYCYVIFCTCDGADCSIQIFDNFIQIDDFEEFSYWFEQQIYYLTDEQFEKINGIWLRMMVKHYYRRDELAF